MADLALAGSKFCSRCSETKSIHEFSKDRSQADGHSRNCRSCRNNLNKDHLNEYSRRWVQENRDKHRASVREAMRRKRATAKGRLESNVSRAVNRALLKAKSREPSFNLLGFTVDELMRHLERQFLPGMIWENYGKWHVDHILPLASFNYSSAKDDEFKAAWALTNLRPMWAKENISKGARRLHLV